MLRSIEQIHAARILHGDIKPDNWLVASGKPDSTLIDSRNARLCGSSFTAGDLCLIDYGRAIDMSFYPAGTTFVGDCHTRGFQCVEMLLSRPWTFQIDTFGFLGTIHCMLFGSYMEARCHKVRGSPIRWGISKTFKRYWQVSMWKEVFDSLLNVPSCDEQPSLSRLRHRLEHYFVSDRRRQQASNQFCGQIAIARSFVVDVVCCNRSSVSCWPSRSDSCREQGSSMDWDELRFSRVYGGDCRLDG